MVQPGIAMDLLSDHALEDQGLLSRFLVVSPASSAGSRFWKPTSPSPELDAYTFQITEVLQAAGVQDASEAETDLLLLHLHPSGLPVWTEFHDHVERQLGKSGPLYTIRTFASKAPEHAVRLAGALQIVEDPQCQSVDRVHMARGIEIANYYVQERLRLAESRVSPEIAAAEALQQWLTNRWPHDEVALADVYQKGPSQLRSAAKARPVMRLLQDHGRVVCVKNARRKEVWRIRQ